MDSLEELKQEIKQFALDRDWDQFHAPKNVASAIAVEAAEILEVFLWKKEDEQLTEKDLNQIKEEMGDVMQNLIRLSYKLDIDLIEATKAKLKKTAERYPVDKAKSKCLKYTEYQS